MLTITKVTGKVLLEFVLYSRGENVRKFLDMEMKGCDMLYARKCYDS